MHSLVRGDEHFAGQAVFKHLLFLLVVGQLCLEVHLMDSSDPFVFYLIDQLEDLLLRRLQVSPLQEGTAKSFVDVQL